MTQLSAKQAVYQELILWTLVFLRNRASQPWWRRLRDRSAPFELELIHNLSNSMFDEDFVAHDLCFLNHQAKYYFDTCSPALSPLYTEQLARIRTLFDLVPEEMRGELRWNGPTKVL